MERLTPEQFMNAFSEGRRSFTDVTITRSIEICNLRISEDLTIEGLTVEGDLKVQNVFVDGVLRFSKIMAQTITINNLNAVSYR